MDSIVLTLDVDWAPDFVIDFVASHLIASEVKATWFIAHMSPAVQRLQERPDLFELGIHPNFLPNSTHGTSHEQVLKHCMELVPDAVSMRTHGLLQSTQILLTTGRMTPIKVDVSLFLPRATNLAPVPYYLYDEMILRLPYFWEDDIEMFHPDTRWEIEHLITNGSGLKIFDFHPIHIYLNSPNMIAYEELKRASSPLYEAFPGQLNNLIYKGRGVRTIFIELVKFLKDAEKTERICDLYEHWKTSEKVKGK